MELIRHASGGRWDARRSNARPLLRLTGWPTHLEGQVILEAGCGAGHFTQIALETAAESFRLSLAIEVAARDNAGEAI